MTSPDNPSDSLGALDDADLVAQARGGRDDALIELLERYGPRVRGRVTADLPRKWQSLLSVDDVLQQAYADAFTGIGRFEPRGDGAFLAWLARLAKNAMLDAIAMLEAAKRGGGRARMEVPPERSLETLFIAVTTLGGTPSNVVAGAEAMASLATAVDRLPPDHRVVVTRYDLQGEPIDAVAEAIGRSVGATYMLRARAHRMLADELGRASRFL